jgi:16S rRNA (guanine(966)-N(2))-methyltransferase RsmD
MSLRVIAGTARGRKLKSVPGDATRPIMDRVKEALFSILGSFVHGSRFLDLFGGTGSVGIEALSRGAAHATFCEIDRAALQVLRDNLQRLLSTTSTSPPRSTKGCGKRRFSCLTLTPRCSTLTGSSSCRCTRAKKRMFLWQI